MIKFESLIKLPGHFAGVVWFVFADIGHSLHRHPEIKMASSRHLGATLRLSKLEARMGHTEMACKHLRAEEKS